MEANKIDVVTLAVLGHLQEVDHALETRSACELRGDVLETDWQDGIDLDLAFLHTVMLANGDARVHPDADAAGDPPTANSVAQALREDHVMMVATGASRSRRLR